MSAPREWNLDELRARFPGLAGESPRPVQCTAAGSGEGSYVNRSEGERQGCARLQIDVEPAETLSIRFGHTWPAERQRVGAQELDERILTGLCEALARGRASTRFGRVVTRSIVDYGSNSTPVAFQSAASLAVQDAIRRGGWDPGDPTDETVALSGRRAG